MSQRYEKLKNLLMELFQLNQPDLDFGFYRIMHARSAEVTQFLDKDLLPQVKAAFAQYQPADKAVIEQDLAKAIEQATSLGADPETLPRVKELRARLADDSVNIDALEAEVYDHLYSFFRRYYSEGDFLSKRVYKSGVYAIPYEGEEVKLHWANADQYYIKTSEYLRDYAFRLRPDDEANPMRVHFRLADAAEGEHGNIKEAAGRERRFKLAPASFVAVEDGEMVIRFTYQPDPSKQKDLNAAAEKTILDSKDATVSDWIKELGRSHIRADGTVSDSTRLRVHLDRYTGRNTFDYFIHKDLGGFLRRELDFYIKNEVMHLDDIESETAPRVEQYLSKIKVIRKIAGKIIEFLAQLEDFQKKLWLKKKFVVETSYCIRLGVIPEDFYPDIAANEAQREEWVRLCAIDELEEADSSLLESGKPGYSVPLKLEFLKVHPTLMLDTQHFDKEFTSWLIDELGDMDRQTDGVLLHSDNFQALSIIQNRLRGKVDFTYIDPPYNTDASPILYKNDYKESSWLALMESRLSLGGRLQSQESAIFVAIDDSELDRLSLLIRNVFTKHDLFRVVVNHYPGSGTGRSNVTRTHEYALVALREGVDLLRGEKVEAGDRERNFRRSGTGENNYRIGRPNSFYAVLVDPTSLTIKGLESPPVGTHYPRGTTAEGLLRIYPIGEDGAERVWTLSYEGAIDAIAEGRLRCTPNQVINRVYTDDERRNLLPSLWHETRFSAVSYGTNLLKDLLGANDAFSYPKSLHTVDFAIEAATYAKRRAVVLDYFAGSGTTGHAVIYRNRVDGGSRSFFLVEAANYFDSVTLPRLKKVTYTPEWKDGKPKRLATQEEAEHSPRIMKVLRLESYEDTLNNLELRTTKEQQSLLDLAQAQGADNLREQYILKYMLDVETRGSQSLLNIAAFTDPTAYKLKVKRPGSDESREVNVDMLETFNWLIGLTVEHIAAPRTFNADFDRDSEGRLRLNGRLKQEPDGRWWFSTVTGTTPDGRKTLVIWRKRPGGESAEGIEQDNLVLDEWFTKQGYSSRDSEFGLIYVNGDNNLENLKAPDDTWKVRLIEEDFHRLMFDTEGV